MKRKPSKQSPLFSKRNSKRNSVCYLFFLFLLKFTSVAESPLIVDFDFPLENGKTLVDSLEEGNRSQLILLIRIYKINSSAFPLPDKNICRKSYIFTVRKDPFTGLYQTTDPEGFISFSEGEDNLLNDFLHREIAILPPCDISTEGSVYYLQKKAILIKKVYSVPFHIFQFIDYDNRISTDWIKEPLSR